MRKFFAAATLVASLGASGAAFAAEATGVVTGVDPSSNTITLDSGRTFSLASGKESAGSSVADNFKPGDKVRVIYRQLNGSPTATSISPRG